MIKPVAMEKDWSELDDVLLIRNISKQWLSEIKGVTSFS
jgi:hypothetical protein